MRFLFPSGLLPVASIGMVCALVYFSFEPNVFIQDFYSKRLMTVSIVLYAVVSFFLLLVIGVKLKFVHSISVILVLLAMQLVNSGGNNSGFIFTDLTICLIALFCFFAGINYSSLSFDRDLKLTFLIFLLPMFLGLKLQFSYFSLVAVLVAFLIYYKKILLWLFIPVFFVIFYYSLVGKSSVIGLFLIFLFLYVTSKHKLFIFLIFVIVFIPFSWAIFTSLPLEVIEESEAYKHFVYFFRELGNGRIDHSTGNRIFELAAVLDQITFSSIKGFIFGDGLGASVDLSQTPDVTVLNVHENPANVRVVHLGVSYVLMRFGVLGLLLYGAFLIKSFNLAVTTRKMLVSNSVASMSLLFSSVYVVFILWDSLVSAGHLFSNPLFWVCLGYLKRVNSIKGVSYAKTVYI